MDIKFCKTNLSLSTRSWMGGSNSSSHIHWLDLQASPAQPRAHHSSRGENIDFRPPVYTLVGHEDLREEEPELDRAEDRAEGLDFSKSSTSGKGKPWKDAKVHGQDGEQDQEFGEEGFWFFKQEEEGPKAPTSLGVDHSSPLKEAPCPRASQSLFFRAKGRRRQHAEKEEDSKARRSSSTTGLDRVQTEETQLDRAEVELTWRSPSLRSGFEYDPTPYQDFSQMDPYKLRASQLHQGQGSHTHFDEEEEEEEPQARSSEEPSRVECS
ncbi:unnamed protein product [Microthlaspi erraticum]|uniref:Uncharacterized protein n=1 Tax=Microthlaspi erraticum TaxID=1685480 RepID=A0A6D2KCI6_9BRAS|nr:unnamed protein product [Microthlaspi erraticum]